MSSPAPTRFEQRPSHISPELTQVWSAEAFGREDLSSSDSEFEHTVIYRPSATTARQERHLSSPSNTLEAVNDFISVNGVLVNAAHLSLSNPSPDDPAPRPEPQSQSEESDADDEEEDLNRLTTEGGGDHFRPSNPNRTTTSAVAVRKRKQEDRDAAATALENERIAASVGLVNKLAPKERAVARMRVAGMDGGRDGEMAVRAMTDVELDGKRQRKRTCRALDG